MKKTHTARGHYKEQAKRLWDRLHSDVFPENGLELPMNDIMKKWRDTFFKHKVDMIADALKAAYDRGKQDAQLQRHSR